VSTWRAESLQEQVGRIVADLPEADGFALAGGAALVVTRVVDRTTRDLDVFGPSAEDVDRLVPAVESALAAAALTVRRERSSRGFARLTVVAGDDATELDLAADARIRPVDTGPLGPMLSAEELGADKLLALFDRAQARDFVDVAALVDRYSGAKLRRTGRKECDQLDSPGDGTARHRAGGHSLDAGPVA
jgi:hypothetical protein